MEEKEKKESFLLKDYREILCGKLGGKRKPPLT